jgi:DNA polymerase
MDWRQLREAIATCQRCAACRPGTKPVMGSGAQQARWLVAAGATTSADDKERTPVAGDAGKLLANMLAAAGLSRTGDVWVTNLIKCRPSTSAGADRAPTAEEAQACRPFLEREIVLTGAGTVLTLGQIAANALLGRELQEPLASARGTVHGITTGATTVPLVTTLHPGELLRRGQDKALAWADLCLAKAADAGRG